MANKYGGLEVVTAGADLLMRFRESIKRVEAMRGSGEGYPADSKENIATLRAARTFLTSSALASLVEGLPEKGLRLFYMQLETAPRIFPMKKAKALFTEEGLLLPAKKGTHVTVEWDVRIR